MRIIPLSEPTAPLLDPDIVWNGLAGDLALTAVDDPVNPAGLKAENALATAVLICLMTDRRVEASELRDGDVNRGWPGDGFDLGPGDAALGSKLWLLRRRAMTPDLALTVEDYAREALQTLIDQGAVARADVAATVDQARRRCDLAISLYGRDGAVAYQDRYAVLWEQL